VISGFQNDLALGLTGVEHAVRVARLIQAHAGGSWRAYGALRHQIDLAVVLPEGYESETADSYPQNQDQNQDQNQYQNQDHDEIDPFAPIAVLSEV
jgi:hypothetical protein